MIRLRLRSGLYLSALLLLAGISLTARATQPVTESQMHSYVLAMLGAAGTVVFGAFWILLITISGRAEKALMASVTRLEGAVAAFAEALSKHDGSEYAHAAAREHSHAPLLEQLDRLETKVGEILRDCESLGCAHRDPAASPVRRRASDPADEDHAGERGRG